MRASRARPYSPFWFPRSAWEPASLTLCVMPDDAERRGSAFPRGVWERETICRKDYFFDLAAPGAGCALGTFGGASASRTERSA